MGGGRGGVPLSHRAGATATKPATEVFLHTVHTVLGPGLEGVHTFAKQALLLLPPPPPSSPTG